MTDDYQYFKNKRNDRVYLSRSIDAKVPYKDESGEIKQLVRPFRIISKVIDGQDSHNSSKTENRYRYELLMEKGRK